MVHRDEDYYSHENLQDITARPKLRKSANSGVNGNEYRLKIEIAFECSGQTSNEDKKFEKKRF